MVRSPRWYQRIKHEEQDIYNEVMLRFLIACQKGRVDTARDPRPYVQKIAFHVCVDWIRRNHREVPFDDITEEISRKLFRREPSILEKLTRDETVEVLVELIGTLPEKCRNILRMTFYEEKSEKAIADALGVPVGTVKSRKSRCLDKLRHLLKGKDNQAMD